MPPNREASPWPVVGGVVLVVALVASVVVVRARGGAEPGASPVGAAVAPEVFVPDTKAKLRNLAEDALVLIQVDAAAGEALLFESETAELCDVAYARGAVPTDKTYKPWRASRQAALASLRRHDNVVSAVVPFPEPVTGSDGQELEAAEILVGATCR